MQPESEYIRQIETKRQITEIKGGMRLLPRLNKSSMTFSDIMMPTESFLFF